MCLALAAFSLVAPAELSRIERQGPEELLETATRAAAQQDWAAARDALLHARRLAPERPDVWFSLGVAHERLGEADEAVAAYREAVRILPGHVPAVENLAAMLTARGDLDGALYVLSVGLAEQPTAGSLHYHEALLRFQRDRRLSEDAIEGLERSLALGYDRPHVFLLLGRVATTSGEAREAVDLLERGLAQTPDDPALLHQMGRALIALDRLDQAIDVLRRAVTRAPADVSLATDLATAYLRASRPTDALAALASHDRGSTTEANVIYLMGQAQQAMGDAAAAETLRRFSELDARLRAEREAGERAMAEVGAGISRWDTGEWEAAALHFRRALDEKPDWAPALSYLAATYLESGRTTEAIQIAERLLRSDPSNAQALMVLGRAHLPTLPQVGVDYLRRAVEAYPYRVVCLLTLADAYVELSRYQEASSLLDRAEAIEPANSWLRELRDRLRNSAPQAGLLSSPPVRHGVFGVRAR